MMKSSSMDSLSMDALRKIIREIKRESPYENVNQLAEAANIGWATVDNLFSQQTKHPRLRTVLKLSWAAGIEWKVEKNGSIKFYHVAIPMRRRKAA